MSVAWSTVLAAVRQWAIDGSALAAEKVIWADVHESAPIPETPYLLLALGDFKAESPVPARGHEYDSGDDAIDVTLWERVTFNVTVNAVGTSLAPSNNPLQYLDALRLQLRDEDTRAAFRTAKVGVLGVQSSALQLPDKVYERQFARFVQTFGFSALNIATFTEDDYIETLEIQGTVDVAGTEITLPAVTLDETG